MFSFFSPNAANGGRATTIINSGDMRKAPSCANIACHLGFTRFMLDVGIGNGNMVDTTFPRVQNRVKAVTSCAATANASCHVNENSTAAKQNGTKPMMQMMGNIEMFFARSLSLIHI